MKKTFTLILLACLISLSAVAQNNFPKVGARQSKATSLQASAMMASPAKVAAVDNKTYYCGVQLDLLRRSAGLGTFNLKDPMNSLTILNNRALNWIDDADYDAPISGAYAKGKYYAFIGKVYSFVTCRKYWGTFDLESGNFSKIADAEPTPTFSNDAMYADYSPVYSMAYDNKNDKMYCLYYDVATYTGGFLNCCLATVDLNSGRLTLVSELQNIYYGIAIDHFGTIYGLTYIVNKDNEIIGTRLNNLVVNGNQVTETDGVAVKNSIGSAFVTAVLQDLDFDNDAWVIRWNQIDANGATYITELNPETGVYTNQQLLGSNATVVGIYSPYTPADSPEAPAHVANLRATSGANGEKTVTLSWTNPTTSWNKHEVEAVTEVHIYRGEEMIAIVTDGVEMGGQSSYTDTEAADGFNTYKVVPCRNEDEEGVPTSIKAFVGYDQPGAVVNLTLTSTDKISANISWEAPLEGKNNGWYDPSTLKYTITRLPDNVVVANDLTATKFSDSSLPSVKAYSYVVKAYNAQGDGLEATSNELTLGPAIKPPYSVEFSDETKAKLWTPYDANGDGDGWRYEAHPWYAWISTNYGNRGDDWLFSPDIALEKGQSYRIRFNLYKPYHSSGGKEFVRVAYGMDATVETMTNIIEEKTEVANNESRYYSYTVTAGESGKYNFGLNALGEASNWGTYFTGFSITTVTTKDLAVTGISGPTDICATANNTYIVGVANKGAETAGSYKVQLVDDDDNVLAETNVNTALAAQQEAEVKVVWTPAASLANSTIELYGRVIYDGDGNAANDNTDEPLKVKIGGASNSYWADYYGKDSWTEVTDNSIVPFGFAYKASWSEVIYNAADLGLAEGDYTVSKVSYDYTFGTTVEADVKIYAGTTTKSAFSNGTELIAKNEMTLVSDSVCDIKKGTGTITYHFKKAMPFSTSQNFVIAVDRRYNSYNDGDVFNNHFTTVDALPATPTLQYGSDSSSFDWVGEESTYASGWVPVTHFFVSPVGDTAVREVVIGAFSYSINGGEIFISNPSAINNAALYNIDGKCVANAYVNGKTARIKTANLRGTHILRVNGRAMKVVVK